MRTDQGAGWRCSMSNLNYREACSLTKVKGSKPKEWAKRMCMPSPAASVAFYHLHPYSFVT